jgi:hypothetical protein
MSSTRNSVPLMGTFRTRPCPSRPSRMVPLSPLLLGQDKGPCGLLQRRLLGDAYSYLSFLIGIAGPCMISISDSVLPDWFISQHLTDYIYPSGLPHLGKRLGEIAYVLRILKESIIELEPFYVGLHSVSPQSKRRSNPSTLRILSTVTFTSTAFPPSILIPAPQVIYHSWRKIYRPLGRSPSSP